MLEQINILQEQYHLAFSRRTVTPHVYLYRDESIPDMYSSNFNEVYAIPDLAWLRQYIKEALDQAKSEQMAHVRIHLTPSIPFTEQLAAFASDLGYETSVLLYMMAPLSLNRSLPPHSGCSVRRGEHPAVREDAVAVMQAFDSLHIDPDFGPRKARRKGEIYAAGTIVPYVCYALEKPVGVCEWMLSGDFVRMEDFSILDEWQRKGFGTEMIRVMMDDAEKAGATHMYLTTYADDTAQEMYRKIGFREAAKELHLIWKKS